MNNYEKIKAMSINEMAVLFFKMTFENYCCNEGCTCPEKCKGSLDECMVGIKQWLQQEREG